jgi:hypothetical protein
MPTTPAADAAQPSDPKTDTVQDAPAETTPSKPPSSVGAKGWWIGSGLLLAGAVLASLLLAPESNAGFRDAAAVVALVSAVALGIERILEALWTLVDRSNKGGWWPLTEVTGPLATLDEKAKVALTVEAVKAALDDIGAAVKDDEDALDRIKGANAKVADAVEVLNQTLSDMAGLAPGSARMAVVSHAATGLFTRLGLASEDLAHAAAKTTNVLGQLARATTVANSIAASFTGNPARRLMSLLWGAIGGTAVAGWLGLNLFSAILGAGGAGAFAGKVGIVVTGIVMGLGASPTHELVMALERRKADTGTIESVAPVIGFGGIGTPRMVGIAPIPSFSPEAEVGVRTFRVRATG